MKKSGVFVFLFIVIQASGQSPYLDFFIGMEADSLKGSYAIDMKICRPKQLSPTESVFGKDTSSIAFWSLLPTDFQCEEVMSLTGVNRLRYSNQAYSYEKIIIFTIRRIEGSELPMEVVVPVPYQSFISFIALKDLAFSPGRSMRVNIPDERNRQGRLHVEMSLKDHPAGEVYFFK